jgi:P pilus assembly/Cpx signaling pathway, periplasmic inhibitor/zinc-resistance associated protein
MRRIAFITLAAAALVACSTESTTAPNTSDPTVGAGAYGTAFTVAGGYEPDLYQDRLTNGLPDSLKLTSDQQAKIKALIDAFNASTKADHDALAGLLGKARDLSKGKTTGADSVAKLLAKGAEITARLAAAQAKLKADIDAVLTADQRAWLASHEPKNCKPGSFAPLTDAQKAQIKALEQAFQTNNKADLDAVKAALDSAKGKTPAERDAILSTVRAAQARLEAARKALKEAITGVLTADQKSSGCIPLG